MSPSNFVLEHVLTYALELFTLQEHYQNNHSNGVVKLVDVWLRGKLSWVSFLAFTVLGHLVVKDVFLTL